MHEVDQSEDDLVENFLLAVNFVVSLLKKQNVRSLHIESTMGPAQRLGCSL